MSWFVDLVFFCGIGRLLIYLFQIFGPAIKLSQTKLAQTLGLGKLLECDLCLGVWVYFFLAVLLQFSVWNSHYTVLDYFLTGAIISFIMHLLVLGWRAKFGETIIISE